MFDCLLPISQVYQVPPAIIRSVMEVESRGRNVTSENRDGSIDYGVMQINSWWLPILKKQDIQKNDLMNVCTNISVGAWLLQYSYRKTGNWKEAVAAYHAGHSKRHKPYAITYANKVFNQEWLGSHTEDSAKN